MKPESHGDEFRVSRAIYGRLLRAYPPRHRAQYGAAMAQLFRDQCRDAWNQSQTWGLCQLWLRVLPDLACTSIWERFATLKARKTMTEKLAGLSAFRTTPMAIFLAVFMVVFLIVFTVSVAITFILPESYASTARVKVELDDPQDRYASPASYDPYFIQTTFEIIQSPLVLSNVIARLNLNEQWGKKYGNGQLLKTTETLAMLKQHLQLAPVRNTRLIAITVYSDDKLEAAQIANLVARAYVDYRQADRTDFAAKGVQELKDNYGAQARQIEQAQAEVETLQKQFGILDDAQHQDLIRAMPNAEKSIQEKTVRLARLRGLSQEQRRNVLPTVVADSNLNDLLAKLDDAEQNFAAKTNDYSPASSELRRARSSLDRLNLQIDDRVAGIMTGLESQLAASQAATDVLAAKIAKSKPTPENRPYWEAKQNLEYLVESHKMLFAALEKQILTAGIPKAEPAQITDPAEPGRAPVRPNKTLNILVGAIGGIILATAAGAAFAFLSCFIGKRKSKTAAAA